MSFKRLAVFFVLAALVTFSAFGQATTSALVGTVTTDGKPLPGATVTVSSPALQGVRTTVTGDNGAYQFPSLPPGTYTVAIELEGLQKVTRRAELQLAGTSRVDADLKVSAVAEAITVTASAPSVLETPQVSTNLDRQFVENLPLGRTITQRIQIAPGTTNSGPNNQTVISGAPSYDNLYLVNGVVINENLRGTPHNLFIEDAIQETTILNGGVSAEYGRFTGGVISTITKSGGNEFSGSLRDNLTNDKWTKVSDYVAFTRNTAGNLVTENPHINKINPIYEATLGGRIIRDRLWFFAAGRYAKTAATGSTLQTNIPYETTSLNRRQEYKLTGQITPKHTLVGSYINVGADFQNNSFGAIVDLNSLYAQSQPSKLKTLNYNGIITNNFLIEGQWSRKSFAFVGGGAPYTDVIRGTLLRDIATARRAWSPTFGASTKHRDNKDYLGKATYFISSKSLGTHNIVGGYDEFHDLRTEDNPQSGSGFRFWGDFVYVGTNVYIHADPNDRSYIQWNPIVQSSLGADLATKSFFVNDKWDLNNHVSFNLGVRHDNNTGEDEAHNKVVDDQRWSPRLGIIYDIFGNGRNRVTGSFSRYVTHVDSGIGDSVSAAGQSSAYYYDYKGPEINPIDAKGNLIGTPVPTEVALKTIFDWFQSQGGTNANQLLFAAFIPGLTSRLAGKLASPYMDEVALGYGMQIGNNGFVRVDSINRNWKSFYGATTTLATGQVNTPSGKQDLTYYNNTDDLTRKYHGIQLQANYRLMTRINVGGNYTWSKLRGNVESETSNNGTVASIVGATYYPEYFNFAQNNPIGYLNEDIRHKANGWIQFDAPIPFGSLNLSVLERYHSGQPYSAAGSIIFPFSANFYGTGKPGGVVNPGYANPPTSSSPVTYYFSGRNEFRLDNISQTDFNVNYSFPISRLNFFVKADLLNAFNRQGVEFNNAIRTTVRTRSINGANIPTVTDKNGKVYTGCTGCLRNFNPFTDTPREFIYGVSDPNDPNGYNFVKAADFGYPTSAAGLQQARTYRFAVGVRF